MLNLVLATKMSRRSNRASAPAFRPAARRGYWEWALAGAGGQLLITGPARPAPPASVVSTRIRLPLTKYSKSRPSQKLEMKRVETWPAVALDRQPLGPS